MLRGTTGGIGQAHLKSRAVNTRRGRLALESRAWSKHGELPAQFSINTPARRRLLDSESDVSHLQMSSSSKQRR